MVIKIKKTITNLTLIAGLNPFFLSGLSDVFKTDLNIFYLLAPTLFMITQKKIWILGILFFDSAY